MTGKSPATTPSELQADSKSGLGFGVGKSPHATLDEQSLLKDLDRLRHENATLRRAVVDHPAAETLRFLAPFIRDAITADVWKPGPGTESVEHELAAALAWLDRTEAATA